MWKLIGAGAAVVVLLASRAHSGVVVVILIGAGVPVALLLAGTVGWLLWRAVHDSLLPRPVVRELPAPPRQQVRAEVTVIRKALKEPDGK